jgi:trimeric autotransporter adhesin
LAALAQIPVTQWNVKGATTQHVGPMAQDFYAAFHLGEDDTHINTVDAQGVALASIQGLNQIVEDEIATRDGQIAQLQARLDALENYAGPVVAENVASNAWIWLMVGVLLGSGAFWLGSRRAKGGIQ